jgi:hypothetical protein
MSTATLPSLDADDQARMFSLFEARALRIAGRQMAFVGSPDARPAINDVGSQALANLGSRAVAFTNLDAASIWLAVDERTVKKIISELRATLFANH